MTASAELPNADLEAAQLPAALGERLLAAAKINALTEIEMLVEELKTLGAGPQALAHKLEGLLLQYDTDGIAALVRRASLGEE